MKKTCLLVFFAVLIIPAFTLDAVVVSVLGKAEVQTSKGWQPMKTGAKLTAGTLVSTGFKSQAVLSIGKSTVTVQPLSRLTIEQLTERADSDVSKIYLDAGSIKADIKAAENKRVGFTVKSPVATASVRGTSGTIDSFGTLESTSGVWMVAPASENDDAVVQGVAVAKGSIITVGSDGRVTPPQQANAQAATGANPVSVSPSVAEASASVTASPAAAAQSAAGTAGDTRVRVPITVGWED